VRVIDISDVHDKMISSLARCHRLDGDDREAIRTLPVELRHYHASSHLVREGQTPHRCAFLVEGFAYRQKLTLSGHRSLCSLQLPGDFVDLQNIYLSESDHDVQALTEVTAVDLPVAVLRALAGSRPNVGTAMWIQGLSEASIFREWLLNIGRRDARSRMAHLLCEFSIRLQAAGVPASESHDLPMTQEQLGDALGLTAVHVNRVLKSLEENGVIIRGKRQVRVDDWDGLRRIADFNPRYLHLRQEG
jgi:CRP-like cAMP-binding protein